MFASQERRTTRKPFQKPNILRRKPKVVRLNTQKNNEFSELAQLSATSCGIQPTSSSILVGQPQGEYHQSLHAIQAPKFGVVEICDKNQIDTSETLEIDGDSITIYAHNAQVDNHGSQISNICNGKNFDSNSGMKVRNQARSHGLNDDSAQTIALQSTNKKTADKFKCDVANCTKSFWTEARLQRHKNVHNKPIAKTPTILDCPVKKTDAEGVETKCGRTFLIRKQLMKHLNEDHAAEDALFRCGVCERRFFWAGGARAHQAGACGRAFVCGWAGCGRVFRHPCRLREHARAHTGDRPYPCHYPNCGWSFRSASKLVRHARRHTGERRHECGACGRAFLRREHLRDHAARYHADGSEETLQNVNAVYVKDVKKSHKKNEGKLSAPKKMPTNTRDPKETLVVTLFDQQGLMNFDAGVGITFTTSEQLMKESQFTSAAVEADVGETADVGAADVSDVVDVSGVTDLSDVADERCARTHCTWPLQREHADYVEEDTQVEQSESSESNIYTVRSDLFLHGNVLINEDSEFIISRASTGDEGASAAEGEEGDSDATLGLIDSHPTIDLMQEELMYADAVDESSFRVFLLNGEELT